MPQSRRSRGFRLSRLRDRPQRRAVGWSDVRTYSVRHRWKPRSTISRMANRQSESPVAVGRPVKRPRSAFGRSSRDLGSFLLGRTHLRCGYPDPGSRQPAHSGVDTNAPIFAAPIPKHRSNSLTPAGSGPTGAIAFGVAMTWRFWHPFECVTVPVARRRPRGSRRSGGVSLRSTLPWLPAACRFWLAASLTCCAV